MSSAHLEICREMERWIEQGRVANERITEQEATIAELTETAIHVNKERMKDEATIAKLESELTALRNAAWFILRLGRDGMWDSAHMGHAHGALAALVKT